MVKNGSGEMTKMTGIAAVNFADADMAPAVSAWLGGMRVLELALVYRVERPFRLRWFPGGEIRGSIGRQLKSFQSCFADADRDCRECPADRLRECAYHLAFAHGGNLRKGFFLRLGPGLRRSPAGFAAGDRLCFGLVLTGELISRAPFILEALAATRLRLGEKGSAPRLVSAGWRDESGRFIEWRPEEPPPSAGFPLPGSVVFSVPAVESGTFRRLELDFLTPAEITLRHGRRVTVAEELDFRLLVVRLVQKLKSLSGAGDGVGDKFAEEVLFAAADQVTRGPAKLSWQRLTLRRKGFMPRGGLAGRVAFEGDFAPFLPLLEAGRYFGLGKGPAYGLGLFDWRLGPGR